MDLLRARDSEARDSVESTPATPSASGSCCDARDTASPSPKHGLRCGRTVFLTVYIRSRSQDGEADSARTL